MPLKSIKPPPPLLDLSDLAAARLHLAAVARESGVPEDAIPGAVEAGLEAEQIRRLRPPGDAGMLVWMEELRRRRVIHQGLEEPKEIPLVPLDAVLALLLEDSADPNLAPLVALSRRTLAQVALQTAAHVRNRREVHDLFGYVLATGEHVGSPAVATFEKKKMPQEIRSLLRKSRHGPPRHDFLDILIEGDAGMLFRRTHFFPLFPEHEAAAAQAVRPKMAAHAVGELPVPELVDKAYARAWLYHSSLLFTHRARLVGLLHSFRSMPNAPEGAGHLVGAILVTGGAGTTHDATVIPRDVALDLVRLQPALRARLKKPRKGPEWFQLLVWADGYKSLLDVHVKGLKGVPATTGGVVENDLGGWS